MQIFTHASVGARSILQQQVRAHLSLPSPANHQLLLLLLFWVHRSSSHYFRLKCEHRVLLLLLLFHSEVCFPPPLLIGCCLTATVTSVFSGSSYPCLEQVRLIRASEPDVDEQLTSERKQDLHVAFVKHRGMVLS